jgi:NAD(P)-dependent dehydrogenase (short-subunit alcohol dehydrogenase family)
MARIFITGSADGLGKMAAQRLVAGGHEVVLHARSPQRARDGLAAVPGARDALVGDLSSIAQTRTLANAANAVGPFDAVIHNAAVGSRTVRTETVDGLEHVFAVNVLAAYLLTALIERPRRLVYLSSGMHRSGEPDLSDLQWRRRPWNGSQAYANSKLLDVVLAFAVARRWPGVLSNAVEPGWVATKMGGPGAPDDLAQGSETQVWLAVSEEPDAMLTGRCFYHKKIRDTRPAASDITVQERLLDACRELTGVELPAEPAVP